MENQANRMLFVFVISLFLFIGCESSFTPDYQEENDDISQDLSSISGERLVNENALRGRLKAGANVLKTAIKSSQFRNELYDILTLYAKQKNRFDAVSFAELQSNNALHMNSDINRGIDVHAVRVNDILQEAFQKAKDNSQGDAKSLRKFLVEDLANIYMPNLSTWDGKEIPTITWHPLDSEEASNIGYKPNFGLDKSKIIGWKKVTVNEQYGKENPVLIVMPGKSFSYEPADLEARVNSSQEVELSYVKEPCADCDGGGGGGSGENDETVKDTNYYPACDDGNCDELMEAQIGWVELRHYPCGWFCSGRRIYFAHQEAYQNLENSPVTVETKRASVYMDSDDRGSWIRYYTLFDHNWPSYQLSKKLKIYIGRGGGIDSIVEGVYKFLSGGDVIQTAYDTYLELTAKDLNRDMFFNGILDRDTFKSSNTSSFGHGTKDGYRVYRVDNQDGSYIRYTLPHQTY